ncbi:sulfurtransferase [Haloferax profundi]|uniref:Thiosulfate sulfurtransferase n=1 Tax=Haloferax profundi TaxID=1544718 RepID=A0A0W1SUU2_9EURY|nr:sulfurtransferase [Haloferax profundi]KTG30242.1 thiosulfate sulfurtransferase [Haloferax profundi]
MVDVASADWLSAHLGDVRVVDVRDGWEFDGIGHLPNAVSIPFDEFRSAEGDVGMLPGSDVWSELLSNAGISADDDIVAYDDMHGVFAARFLVTALLYGHDPTNLHLLDGDFSAWTREYETTTEASDVPDATYEVSDPSASPLVDFETVEAALDDSETVIVDTRDAAEFEEGHLPGAVNLDWRELVDDETRGLKSRDDLDAILEPAGITPDRRIVLYCNTARRISHTYVVLSHLGYEHVEFYEGSLTEWEARDGALVEG